MGGANDKRHIFALLIFFGGAYMALQMFYTDTTHKERFILFYFSFYFIFLLLFCYCYRQHKEKKKLFFFGFIGPFFVCCTTMIFNSALFSGFILPPC